MINKVMLKQKIKKIGKLTTKQTLVLVVLALFGFSAFVTPLVRADNYDAQIKQLQEQNAANQSQAKVLQSQAETYQQAVDQLQGQINTLQGQIDANTAKSNDLQTKITAAETELAKQRKIIGESIRSMYLEGQISTLEMLASSKNLSDFVDKQQYRNSVQNKIKDTMDKITALKAQMRSQKEQIQQLLNEENSMQGQLSADRSKQAELLAYTEGQKASYEAQIKATNQQISSLRAQQLAFYNSISGGGKRTSGAYGSFQYRNLSQQQYCGGGYRFCAWGHDDWVSTEAGDTWGLHLARECVHYAADRAARGRDLSAYFGSGRGNAGNWPSSLRYAPGVYTDNTPEVGSVAIADIPPVGHAMYVEYITDDGWVGVSQMNWDVQGHYSTMEIKASGAVYVHFH